MPADSGGRPPFLAAPPRDDCVPRLVLDRPGRDLDGLALNHGSTALADPFVFSQRLVADHVLPSNVLKLPSIAPMSWISVLQPENCRGRVWRHMFNVGRVDWLLRACGHENLNRVVIVA